MRVRFRVLGAVVAVCFGFACRAATLVRLGYADVESFPYQMANGEAMSNPPGLAIDVIRQAAEDVGVEIIFQRFPAKRLPVELKAGRIDGAFMFSYSDERSAFARFPMRDGHLDSNRRVARLRYNLYRLRGDAVDWNGEWFSRLQGAIGANAGFAIVPYLRRMDVKVEEAKSVEQNFAKLRMRRLQAVVAQDLTADAYLEHVHATDIEKLPTPVEENDYFLVFGAAYTARNPELVERIWNRIGEIRENKTREVLPKYLKARQ